MSTCPSSALPCERIRVLLVDDDETFRESLAGILRDDGHAVLDYPSPGELPPLGRLRDVEVLITDFSMPERDGLSLADELHARYPAIPVIMVTAYRTPGIELRAAARDFVKVVNKPVQYEDLHSLVHRLAATRRAAPR